MHCASREVVNGVYTTKTSSRILWTVDVERVGLHHQLNVKGVCERRCVRDGKCVSQTRRVFPAMKAIGMNEVVVRNGRICPSLILLPFRGHLILLLFRGLHFLLLRVLLSLLYILCRFLLLLVRYRLARVDFLGSFELVLELIGVLMDTIRDKYAGGRKKNAYCLNLQSELPVFQGWGGSRKNQQRLSTPNSCQIQC